MFVVLGRKLIKLSVFVSNVDQILLTRYKNLAAKNAPTTLQVRMTDRPDNENSSTYHSKSLRDLKYDYRVVLSLWYFLETATEGTAAKAQ